MIVSVFWTWPICLWRLESIRLLHWLMFGGHSCGFYAFSNYLPRWQSAMFCSLYCLPFALSTVWVVLRVGLDAPPRHYLNGPLESSLRFGVFSILIFMCGHFAFWFRVF